MPEQRFGGARVGRARTRPSEPTLARTSVSNARRAGPPSRQHEAWQLSAALGGRRPQHTGGLEQRQRAGRGEEAVAAGGVSMA